MTPAPLVRCPCRKGGQTVAALPSARLLGRTHAALREAVEGMGVTIVYEAPAVRLVWDAAAKRVTGVVTEQALAAGLDRIVMAAAESPFWTACARSTSPTPSPTSAVPPTPLASSPPSRT